jgi:hypothetical protein
MKVITIESWEEYPNVLSKIQSDYSSLGGSRNVANERTIYRGQSTDCWKLNSTLERYSPGEWTVQSYLSLVKRCLPRIEEKVKEHKWNLPSFDAIEQSYNKWFNIRPGLKDWLEHLRHHGFPSPLLDWSESPFVAAYFAFSDQCADEYAAVYVYCDMPRGSRIDWAGKPHLNVYPQRRNLEGRAEFQKPRFSICTIETDDSEVFASHEDVFGENPTRQDLLTKIRIRRTERLKVLRYLNEEKGINEFRLFKSEDSLMKALAINEIELE